MPELIHVYETTTIPELFEHLATVSSRPDYEARQVDLDVLLDLVLERRATD